MSLAEIVEAELDRLAARRESPEAFEALFWCLRRYKQGQQPASDSAA